MCSALEALPGIGKVEYQAGVPEFKVHYDASRVNVDKIVAACNASGHGVEPTK